MGVPGFMSWLKQTYPQAVVSLTTVLEGDDEHLVWYMSEGQGLTSMPRADYLYLDLNAAVHTCAHPTVSDSPHTDGERFQLLEEYLDRIMELTRPTTCVHLALDGVAPR